VNFSADERAELIGAVTRTTEMVGALLDLVDRIVIGFDDGRQLTQADVERLREHSTLWRQQLERLRQRLASLNPRAADEGAVGNKKIAEDCNAR
jgi:hypothetical protein